MAEIISNRAGYVVKAKNAAVAANQAIRKGDIVVLGADGLATKGAIGATVIDGFAVHAVTTGATVTANDRVIFVQATPESEFKGELSNAAGAATTAMDGDDVGFIDEDGKIKLDPAAVAKQATIESVVGGGDRDDVVTFTVKSANRRIS